MKSREEYLSSIYTKRDERLKKRKKYISAITSVACLAVCFAAVFTFIPKKLRYKSTNAEIFNGMNSSENKLFEMFENVSEDTDESSEELLTFLIPYNSFAANIMATNNDAAADSAVPSENESSPNIDDNKLLTEIAAETPDEVTRQVNFGYVGEPFDPDRLLSGTPAVKPENPDEDYITGVTEPNNKNPDSADEETKAKTTKANLRTSDEAIEEALKYIPNEETSKIIEDKTQVTVSRTANGKTSYTVYFYTENKLFTIELNAATLEMIECKEKNTINGNVNYYSPAHFPETTAALPEYKPQ